jgi:hypothetical protein
MFEARAIENANVTHAGADLLITRKGRPHTRGDLLYLLR